MQNCSPLPHHPHLSPPPPSPNPQGVENKKTYELSEEDINKLREEVGKFTTESDLRRIVAQNIKRLKDIGCYRGRRHIVVSWDGSGRRGTQAGWLARRVTPQTCLLLRPIRSLTTPCHHHPLHPPRVCPFAARTPRITPAPARVSRRPSPARRSRLAPRQPGFPQQQWTGFGPPSLFISSSMPKSVLM
jgi:hypothetical protein